MFLMRNRDLIYLFFVNNFFKEIFRFLFMEKRFTLWLFGYPCAGKTTVAQGLARIIRASRGYEIAVHDADVVRKGLCSHLKYSKEDRDENLRLNAEVCKILNIEARKDVVATFISPLNSQRKMIERIVGDNFRLIYVDAPPELCEKRDCKGMYAKVRRGEIKGFTGVDDLFEVPENSDLVLHTDKESPEDSARRLYNFYCSLNGSFNSK